MIWQFPFRVLIEQYGDTFEYLGIYEGQEAPFKTDIDSISSGLISERPLPISKDGL